MQCWIPNSTMRCFILPIGSADHKALLVKVPHSSRSLHRHTLHYSKDRWSPGVICAKKQTYTQIEVQPPPSPLPPSKSGVNWTVSAGMIIGALLIVYVFVRKRFFQRSEKANKEDEAKIYASAVARTRQAIYVHRAIGFMATNSPARVMVELERALKENSICRSELVAARHSQDQLQGLYRMHLMNAVIPPDYATLLQLREMLGISAEIADKIEKDIFEIDAFTI